MDYMKILLITNAHNVMLHAQLVVEEQIIIANHVIQDHSLKITNVSKFAQKVNMEILI